VPIEASNVAADLNLDYRQKGLLWYSTYKVKFSSNYKFSNPSATKQKIKFKFQLPTQQAIYDNLKLSVGNKQIPNVFPSSAYVSVSSAGTPYGVSSQSASVISGFDELEPGQSDTISISYDSQGLDNWRYSFGSDVSEVKNFTLKINTDFDEID